MNFHSNPDNVIREINRCNQRGGRMLSLVDLIEAGTLSLDLAAYLAARVCAGDSFLIGALPGGAGKTAVMGALLACVSSQTVLIPTGDPSAFAKPPAVDPAQPRCYVCHEIGSGYYYAYLWGSAARAFFALPAAGHQTATNLHVDTYEQCRLQLCDENRISASSFNTVRLMIFLHVGYTANGIQRTIDTVWQGDGSKPHTLLYAADGSTPPPALQTTEETTARRALEQLCEKRIHRIEEFRQAWLEIHQPTGSKTGGKGK